MSKPNFAVPVAQLTNLELFLLELVKQRVHYTQSMHDEFIGSMLRGHNLDPTRKYHITSDGIVTEAAALAEVQAEVQANFDRGAMHG